jgi:hypothetical protein
MGGRLPGLKAWRSSMNRTQLPHYHIRWSGKTTLDWERFNTPKEAETSAKQLMLPGEAYTIEEHDGTCARCRAMELKSEHGTSKGASA